MSDLAIKYSMMKKKKRMAEGGETHDSRAKTYEGDKGTSSMGSSVRSANRSKSWAKDSRSSYPSIERSMAKDSMGRAKETAAANLFAEHDRPKPNLKGLAEGGFLSEEEDSGMEMMPEEHEQKNSAADHEDDLIYRAMCAHKNMYSKGGMIANGGEDDVEDLADSRPNNFDDLALRDDLESSYDGENSGDHLGNEQLDEDEHDIVSKVMRSRMKKDRLPNPR